MSFQHMTITFVTPPDDDDRIVPFFKEKVHLGAIERIYADIDIDVDNNKFIIKKGLTFESLKSTEEYDTTGEEYTYRNFPLEKMVFDSLDEISDACIEKMVEVFK